jgi:predicted MPP superfamily phosphohydrolase
MAAAGARVAGRRGGVTRRMVLGAPAAAVVGAWGLERRAHAEAEQIVLTRKRVPIRGLAAPVRVLHIADFHLEEEETLAYLERSFELGLSQKPDLICVSGDFITDGLIDFSGYRGVLRKLAAGPAVYATTGNHDGGAWSSERKGYKDTKLVRRLLEESGIECLQNRAVWHEVRGQRIRVVGVADFWSGEARPVEAFAQPDRGAAATLLIAHSPDYKEDLSPFSWDLMLAGHTHGGQIRLPIINWAPFVPIRDRRFLEGLHQWNGRQIHVTRGVGAILRTRLNCPPELSVLDLLPEGMDPA